MAVKRISTGYETSGTNGELILSSTGTTGNITITPFARQSQTFTATASQTAFTLTNGVSGSNVVVDSVVVTAADGSIIAETSTTAGVVTVAAQDEDAVITITYRTTGTAVTIPHTDADNVAIQKNETITFSTGVVSVDDTRGRK